MEENFVWNGIWNRRFLVRNGNGTEENCRHGIWKNRLPFHSKRCPASRRRHGGLGAEIQALENLAFFLQK